MLGLMLAGCDRIPRRSDHPLVASSKPYRGIGLIGAMVRNAGLADRYPGR
jgi:hypothetical protein